MDENPGSHAGGLIRACRLGAGLTQQQLADTAGLSVGVVRDLEQGRTTRPHAESVRRLASALRLNRQQAIQLSRAARGHDDVAGGSAATGQASGLRIAVLGPLAAWRCGVQVALGPPMQRAVLGLLALYVGTGLSRSAIIDALWGDDPPVTAVPMVQSYISRLRRLLGPVCPLTAGNGYRLQPGTCEVDLVTFATLVDRAREAQAAGELATACQAYEGALGLWRGDPLADAELLRAHPAVARLSQQRADAVIGYAEVASVAGRPDRALPQLRELAAREPLNERTHARLMIALAGSGQQAAALGVYDLVRRRLDDQLGVQPGAELAEAHAQVLSQQIPARTSHSGGWLGRAGVGQEVPRQLPASVRHFAGRTAELAALTALLDQAGTPPRALLISAIGGTAGVGKTALAVWWAHQVAERFPDGHLFVNLRGYDSAQPLTAADALAGFLRALGVPGQNIPAEEAERAARYRSLTAGKRMLVVLDNAGGPEQVRPLLPGTPGCVVVVTSRDALAGLVARDGATRLDLDLLRLEDAVGLLRTLIGGRVDADPAAAAVLASQCCRLPLALRIAAELAAARPAVPVAELGGELANRQRRLDLLDADGDPRSALRAVFSWSCRHLDAHAARAFRRAGLHPGPDLDRYGVAALAGTTAGQAARLLDGLARTHLIQPVGPGRYGMHDLLRAYALERAMAEDEEEARQLALTRLFDYYLASAAAAMDVLYPAERHRRPRIPAPAIPSPPLASRAAARSWLDAERATLVDVAAYTAAHGWPGHTVSLAATLFRYLEGGGHCPEAIAIHTYAHRAARRTGDHAAEADALTSLGLVHARQGRYQQASDNLQRALALCRQADNQADEVRALGNLGIIAFQQGHYKRAVHHIRLALSLSRKTGDKTSEASALTSLGSIGLRQGHYQQATDHLQQALALYRETRNRTYEAYVLDLLGLVDLRQGRYQQATDRNQRALDLARQTGNRACEAYALTNLGAVDLRQRRLEQADERHRQALALFREIGDHSGEADAHNGLGDVFLATGQVDHARAEHATALGLADQIGDTYEQACAHNGLARASWAAGDHAVASRHWRQALALYTGLGAPEAGDVRAQLKAAEGRRAASASSWAQLGSNQ